MRGYGTIVVDPPWRYFKRAGDATHRARCPYSTMSVEQIISLPVSDVAAPDSLLWLWTTNAFLPVAFDIVRAWRFEFKTMLTWVKPHFGIGDWLRGQTEHCLLCARGRPIVRLTNQSTALFAPRTRHSEKPGAFYLMAESLGLGPHLDVFARKRRPGWDCFGDEVEGEYQLRLDGENGSEVLATLKDAS